MTFLEALSIADAKSNLIGSNLNGELIEDVLIIPTDTDNLKSFINMYMQTANAQQAITPFIQNDLKVVALFKREYLFKHGVFSTIDL